MISQSGRRSRGTGAAKTYREQIAEAQKKKKTKTKTKEEYSTSKAQQNIFLNSAILEIKKKETNFFAFFLTVAFRNELFNKEKSSRTILFFFLLPKAVMVVTLCFLGACWRVRCRLTDQTKEM